MNTVNCVVTEVLDVPKKKYGRYFVHVEFNSYGRIGKTHLMFKSLEKAKGVAVGYEFDS